MNARKRVVVLTRPGSARERTGAAIAEAGADVVAVLDPAVATEAEVRDAKPDAVLVILDPATEQALQKFDGVLGDPGLEIMFEDAEVAAKREGWEAARWARHLGAKLYGHGDVLPRAKGASPASDSNQRGGNQDARFRQEMEALQRQVAAMPDVPRARVADAAKTGAVVIAAGVGGPDAVRQLLELPQRAHGLGLVVQQLLHMLGESVVLDGGDGGQKVVHGEAVPTRGTGCVPRSQKKRPSILLRPHRRLCHGTRP